MELASRFALGGAKGDTYQGQTVQKVHSDGVYGFVKSIAVAILAAVADVASRPDVATLADGTSVPVGTNGLTYVVEGGVYVVQDFEVSVDDEDARDLLTEMELNQRAVIANPDRVDRWDGTQWLEGKVEEEVETYEELPPPNTVDVGTEYTVTNDPEDTLNGKHIAMGAAPGSLATYWDQV